MLCRVALGTQKNGTHDLRIRSTGGTTEVKRSLPRVVPCFRLLGLTPSGLFMGLSNTLIYTSELILCSTICVPSTLHNIHMYDYRSLNRNCGRQKEPAILISTLLLQTHAPQLYSLALTQLSLPPRMHGMQRMLFSHAHYA